MLIKTVKYIVAMSIFILFCIAIYEQYSEENAYLRNTNNNRHYNEVAQQNKESIRLKIPRISFDRPLYSLNDYRNDLEKNIIFVDSSAMPDEEKGNVIIAGHNGNSDVSFFKDLHRLRIGDRFYIYYEGVRYKYVIVDRYLVNKTGTVAIRRDRSKKGATLITCYGLSQQLIFIGEIREETKK